MAKAILWSVSDAEVRKRGEQTGLDTLTTGVSNPNHSFSFRASASDLVQKAAFAIGVPHNIYAFHRYTVSSTFLS